MVYNIHIQSNRIVPSYVVSVSNPLSIKVEKEEPYDGLSKRFNRYTHKIQYKENDYNPNDYVLCLDNPNAWFFRKFFYFYNPNSKIESVDIFFQSTDVSKTYPLIFGFNYVDGKSYYYTYYFLRGEGSSTSTIRSHGLIDKDDLLTRLIEERGLHVSESYNKFVIRLGEKPKDGEPVLYPKSGLFKERITVTKKNTKFSNYVKYEHDISVLNNVQSFYISFQSDSLFIIGDRGFGKLKSAHVYYYKYNEDKPVIFVFKSNNQTKLYKCSKFFEDVKNNPTKKISDFEGFHESTDLEKTLKEENKEVNKEITFKKDNGENQNILESAHRFNLANIDFFKRSMLTPKIDFTKSDSLNGPWKVYRSSLVSKYSKSKIEGNAFEGLDGLQFTAIYVYYNKDLEPLLVVFISDSGNKFFRLEKGGKSWKETNSVNIIDYDGELIQKLRQIETEKNVIALDETARTHQRAQTRETARPVPSVEIDLLKTEKTPYKTSDKMKISSKKAHTDLGLFYFHTHSAKDNSIFFISSFITKNNKKIIDVSKFINGVTSVDVFFNIYDSKTPVFIGITHDDGKISYFKELFYLNTTFSFSLVKKVENVDLNDELIFENNRINDRLTYQLDKIREYNGIKVESISKNVNGFIIYKHSPKDGKTKTSNVLYNKNLFTLRSNIHEIQNRNYKEIKVYVLDTDTSSPLLLEFSDQTYTHYYGKKLDENGIFWNNLSLTSPSDETLKTNLIEINYQHRNSVLIHVNKKNEDLKSETKYPMRILSNNMLSSGKFMQYRFEESELINSKSVKVSESIKLLDREAKGQGSFYYISHEVEPDNHVIDKKQVAGIRLFITTSKSAEPQEIYFYKDQNSNESKNPLFFYYPPPQNKSKKVYVYFYDDDPRVLLISYMGIGYKRLKIEDDTTWVTAGDVSYSSHNDALKILKKIYGTMGTKLTLTKEGGFDNNYITQKYNQFGTFRQDHFSVKFSDKKKHTSIEIPINNIVKNLDSNNVLFTMLKNLFNIPFDSINVYKTDSGNSLKTILLLEFINESEKRHFQRQDIEGNYWLDEELIYNSNNLQEQLQKLQYRADNTIVYEIDKKNKYNTYISLEHNQSETFNGYMKYTHTPYDKYSKYNGYLMYKGKRFMFDNTVQVSPDNPHPVTYKNVSVYFGSRYEYIPLIIEIVFSDDSSKIYYKHISYESGYYWDALHVSSDLENEQILTELKSVELSLFKSVVILMDIRQNKYGDRKINQVIRNHNTEQINTYPMDDECIRVNDKTHQSEGKCITGSGFGVYEHNIHSCVKENHTCLLRFFNLSTGGPDSYTEIKLYDNNSIENIYYSKPHGDDKVFIYFYTGFNNRMFDRYVDNDPRPLSMSYSGGFYKPKSKGDYLSKWYKDPNIRNFPCQDPTLNSKLVEALSEVVGFLNEVQLEHIPSTIIEKQPNTPGYFTETNKYDVHNFGDKKLKITVSYRNTSCFRVYRHTPYGFHGNGERYRLGNIVYRQETNVLKYVITKPLEALNVYYSLFDHSHKYPLLVSLEFNNSMVEYYELDDILYKKWKITNRVDETNLESTIKGLITKLKIPFDTGTNAQTLFDREECKDESSNTTLIAGATGGAIGTAAIVGVGTTVAMHPHWVIPVVKALV